MSAPRPPHRVLAPAGWAPPRGYANGIAARGTQVFIAGQIGWDASQRLVSPDLVPQVAQALRNALDVLAEAGGAPEHVVRMTWYLTDLAAYRSAGPALGAAYRAAMGRHYPAMSAVQVAGLVEPGAVVEIELTAVIPDEPAP
ncbi:MAG: RidA family protein [Gemmatimonadota bacterium]|jgi:enamine deaminase RidA (YjgF/YER057c/UK114 family)|nr:RidA family protein [Gemmatimonadota bacterium]